MKSTISKLNKILAENKKENGTKEKFNELNQFKIGFVWDSVKFRGTFCHMIYCF